MSKKDRVRIKLGFWHPWKLRRQYKEDIREERQMRKDKAIRTAEYLSEHPVHEVIRFGNHRLYPEIGTLVTYGVVTLDDFKRLGTVLEAEKHFDVVAPIRWDVEAGRAEVVNGYLAIAGMAAKGPTKEAKVRKNGQYWVTIQVPTDGEYMAIPVYCGEGCILARGHESEFHKRADGMFYKDDDEFDGMSIEEAFAAAGVDMGELREAMETAFVEVTVEQNGKAVQMGPADPFAGTAEVTYE